MNENAPVFRLPAVRDLLLAAYSDASRLASFLLYSEQPGLTEARKEFGPNDGLAARVDKLIVYCESRGLMPALVAAVERENPAQYARFATKLLAAPAPPERASLAVAVADVVTFPADVLALKFAGGLHGADQAVAYALDIDEQKLERAIPSTWQSVLLPPSGPVAAKQVLFVNVGNLYRFDYEDIREFARRILDTLAASAPATRHLAMTIHGVGYGLDETEALQSQLAGYLDAIKEGKYPSALEQITLVERNPLRGERLRKVIETTIPRGAIELPSTRDDTRRSRTIEAAAFMAKVGRASAQKPHVFVALPATGEMDDIYHYAIYPPVKAAEHLCEKGDITEPTADLEWIKSKIATASLVIAELTGNDPNVFLLLGYAWGSGRRTLLLAKDLDALPPALRTQRCLLYNRMMDLEKALPDPLRELL